MHMTVTDGCISCGLCADEFPELFHLNDEGVAEAVPSTVASDQEEAARQAANDCPVGVIVPTDREEYKCIVQHGNIFVHCFPCDAFLLSGMNVSLVGEHSSDAVRLSRC